MDAENTHQVFDWLWTSGQLSARDIEQLPAMGIEAVVNLALPTSTNALPGEAELITRHGIVYVQIPVLWEKPELSQLDQFFGVLRLYEGRKVWVHCAKNMRVSAFVYLYRRLCQGEREEVALQLMQKVWVPNDVWQAFISHALHVHSNSSLEADGADAPALTRTLGR
jgi:protein tyrosine phosphatase (PTP) superfamily phosphohydrolase (DUF442 family)